MAVAQPGHDAQYQTEPAAAFRASAQLRRSLHRRSYLSASTGAIARGAVSGHVKNANKHKRKGRSRNVCPRPFKKTCHDLWEWIVRLNQIEKKPGAIALARLGSASSEA